MQPKLYLAPLEGLTNHIFRKIFLKNFSGVDKAFMPFITASKNKRLKNKTIKELKNDIGNRIPVIPQLLANDPANFIELAKILFDIGFNEINWNIGCPSKTVISKKRGSGLLPFYNEIDKFLEKIFTGIKFKISIKTRIGQYANEEFYRLIDVFNKYPVSEIIIHPRTGDQMYKGLPDYDFLLSVINNIKHDVCYNGNIFSLDDFIKIKNKYIGINKFMIGRASIFRPVIFEEIKENSEKSRNELIKRFLKFQFELFEEYQKEFSGEKHLMFKIKDYWNVNELFWKDEKLSKLIKKSKTKDEYFSILNEKL